jgi:hypothetical protein
MQVISLEKGKDWQESLPVISSLRVAVYNSSLGIP